MYNPSHSRYLPTINRAAMQILSKPSASLYMLTSWMALSPRYHARQAPTRIVWSTIAVRALAPAIGPVK